MAKHISRADRCSNIQSELQTTIEKLELLKEELQNLPDLEEEENEEIDDIALEKARRAKAEPIIAKIKELLIDVDSGAIEELYDEIDNWASGMEGTNLENTQKYQTLDECRNNLDSARSYIDQIDTGIDDDQTVQDIIDQVDSAVQDMEDADSELGGCEFPGMFG